MANLPGERAGALRILVVAAEMAPVVKVGGLGDVVGALPPVLRGLGHDVRVLCPRYGVIDGPGHGLRPALDGAALFIAGHPDAASLSQATLDGVPVYFVEHARYFGREQVYGYGDDATRFVYFSRAALALLEALDWTPDVIHCHDWHTAVIPYWMRHDRTVPAPARQAASLLTIHNLAYQGEFDPAAFPTWIDPATLYPPVRGYFNLLSQGINSAHLVTTVSERYAEEITTPEYGEGLDELLTRRRNQLRGIRNGVDYRLYDPARDPAIAAPYTADDLGGKAACKAALQLVGGFEGGPRRPLIGLVSRLVDQKGFDLVAEVLERVLAEVDVQVVILGTGEPVYHEALRRLASRNRRQLAAFLTFDAALAQRIYAGVDMFLMPSRWEPCGLGQMIALRYGAVPIVRATGGLADTVVDYQAATGRGTGFVFRRYDAVSLVIALGRALEVYRDPERWRAIQMQGMRQDLSWATSAARYVEAYGGAIQARGREPAPPR